MNPKVLFIDGWAHSGEGVPITSANVEIASLSPHFFANSSSSEGLSSYANGLRNYLQNQPEVKLIVGWSMGAMIVLELLTSGAHQVGQAILCAGTPCYKACPDFPYGVEAQSLSTFRQYLEEDEHRLLRRFFMETRYPEKLSFEERDRRVDSALAFGKDELLRSLSFLEEFDVRQSISAISVPLKLIHGEQDAIVRYEAGLELDRLLKHSELVPVEGAAHDIRATQLNDVLNREVQAVLSGW